jgi:HK97 family phage major capsid protein
MEIEKKIDAVASSFEEFKKLNDKQLAEIKAKGFASAETVEKVEKANAEITLLSDQVKAMQTAMNRKTVGASDEVATGSSPELRKAFNAYVRKGVDTEFKALSVQSDPDGGFLVMPEMASEIVKKVFESSPIRSIASVQSISSDSLEMIQDTDEMASGWVGEVAARPATNTAQIKKIIIPVHELYANPLASQKLLDDANVNVEAWIAEKVAEKFGRDEATAFVVGNGVGKPRGFMDYAAGTGFGQIEQVVSGSAALLTADGLISLFYALKAPYQANATWLMKRATVAAVRKFKDLQNQYLWQPSLQVGSPEMFLGRPLMQADDIAAEGANALAVAVGDFKAGYQIVDRFGIRVLRDPYSSKPYVAFYTTKRVGGDVKNFEAIKIGKCSV